MSALIPIGASVVAKWPSTSNYYKARILDHQDNQQYVCQFLDGTIAILPSKYVDLPEKFQRTSKKLSLMHNEKMFSDRSITFYSMFLSIIWISLFLSVQYWFHAHQWNIQRSLNYRRFQHSPLIVIRYFAFWFFLQWIFARYFPHMGDQQLIYIRESHPNIIYKHRSNSCSAFLATCSIILIFHRWIPVKELIESHYLLALFSLGIALTLTWIQFTDKFFQSSGPISILDIEPIDERETRFDTHLFLSIRSGIVLWPALNLLLLLNIIEHNHQVSIRLTLSLFLQTIYIINVFLNETSMIRQSLDFLPTSSFDAFFTNLCWIPFTATLTTFYIGKSHRPVHPLFLIVAIFFFVFGFFLQRSVLRQKISFQDYKNSDPADSIVMNDKQRILTSGCWKWCRNPHLLAEIFMAIAWCLPSGFQNFHPWLYAFYIVTMSIYKANYFDRVLRTTAHPDAYRAYTKSVQYNLIPFVY